MCTLTDDQIVSLCKDPTATVLSALQCSNQVIRITESLAVKFGHFVTAQEFRNQQVAHQRLDPAIVNVPTAHRFIQKQYIGYIVMDYINGTTLDLASATQMAGELGKVLNYIHEQEATAPGSLGGGPVSGVLWPEHEEVEFTETNDLQLWLDRRSTYSQRKLDIRRHTLSLCHLDFDTRNIIVDGSCIYLIDWSAAGWFPRYFEHILYQFLPRDFGFYKALEPFLAPLSNEERESAKIVVETLHYSQFHILYVTTRVKVISTNQADI
jgi:serine/threonine protein kinase